MLICAFMFTISLMVMEEEKIFYRGIAMPSEREEIIDRSIAITSLKRAVESGDIKSVKSLLTEENLEQKEKNAALSASSCQ